MLKSKKFWLEVAKVVTAVAFVILGVIYLIFTLHSCEVASRSFFATTGHLIAPWVFLSFAVRMCVDRVHKFSNVLLSFFVDFGQEPQQATGIAFRVKLVETANAAISQLQNEKIGDCWLMPGCSVKLTQKMLKSPQVVVIHHKAYDAQRMMEIILSKPRADSDQEIFAGLSAHEKDRGRKKLFEHYSRLICCDAQFIEEACEAPEVIQEEVLQRLTSLAVRADWDRRFPPSKRVLLHDLSRVERQRRFSDPEGFPDPGEFIFQQEVEKLFPTMVKIVAFFARAKPILQKLPEEIREELFEIGSDPLKKACYDTLMVTDF